MPMDRFTAFGLAVALLGWVVLVADAALVPLFSTAGNMAYVASLRSDLFSVAETTIVSGFGLAIIGVLRSGFSTLHRFFDIVLDRAGASRAAGRPVVRQPPAPAGPAPAVHVDLKPVPGTVEPLEPMERSPSPPIRPQNYVILANGAVEVETLLGTRVFASLDEARDYIR